MVRCGSCSKPLEKVPKWLEGVKVEFVCINCPERKIQNITKIDLTPFIGRDSSDPDEEEVDFSEEEDVEKEFKKETSFKESSEVKVDDV